MKNNPPKIAMISLGCPKNNVDSEFLLGKLYQRGFDMVQHPLEADAVIINTCGFIEPAVKETRDNIKETLALKKTKPDLRIIVMGCYVSKGTEKWEKTYPELDGIFPLGSHDRIVKRLQECFSFNQGMAPTLSCGEHARPVATTLSHFAYLKIAEGCNRHCTFCTIPSIRGRTISKSIEDLTAESSYLAQRGVKELILIAQDTTSYGIDRYRKPALLDLLKKLVRISGIQWIRLLYAYPEHIENELLNFILDEPKMVHYLDMPIQHSHEKILKQMGRSGTASCYKSVFTALRSADKNFCLRTTVMTGFPGETRKEFDHLLNFIKKIKFDRLGAFKYVREKGTSSYLLSGQLDKKEMEKRREILMLEQQKIHFVKNASWVGKKIKTLVDVVKKEGFYQGRTFRDAPDIDAMIDIKSLKKLYPGWIGEVEITSSQEYDLEGRV
ncbi:MAG: 30S ribosomal protein S12 methylthiotransferase RimO [Candidatus Aureabacteria bacterium]|nr:30S ribosomal protein S12 methylthiotransferase RimO [Candidatus Auribacterota bacterium]